MTYVDDLEQSSAFQSANRSCSVAKRRPLQETLVAVGATGMGRFKTVRIFKIVLNVHRINWGEVPLAAGHDEDTDFHLIETEDPDAALACLMDLVARRIPRRFGLDRLRDIQVLTTMLRGSLGSRNLNHALQQALNPEPPAQVERFGWRFAPGDRVMETRNDYDREIFNGNLGQVARIDQEEGAVIVTFDGREVSYPFGEIDTLMPAFATTIHKSQGSEYPAVVIPVMAQHYTMLARNLLYTGVTRGKRLVVLVGQRKAIGMAVRSAGSRRR